MQPSGFQPGTRSDRVVSLIDVYPTIIDMLGLKLRPDLDGTSLKPLISNPKSKWDRVAISTIGRGNHAVRTERWNYARYFDGTEELYDFEKDPNEWQNLAGKTEYAEIQSRLRDQVPIDKRFTHFARYGDFKVAIPSEGSIQVYGPGDEIIKESKNVAKQHPDVVQAVKKYMKTHPQAAGHFNVPLE